MSDCPKFCMGVTKADLITFELSQWSNCYGFLFLWEISKIGTKRKSLTLAPTKNEMTIG